MERLYVLRSGLIASKNKMMETDTQDTNGFAKEEKANHQEESAWYTLPHLN
jgi:hypothetical protein